MSVWLFWMQDNFWEINTDQEFCVGRKKIKFYFINLFNITGCFVIVFYNISILLLTYNWSTIKLLNYLILNNYHIIWAVTDFVHPSTCHPLFYLLCDWKTTENLQVEKIVDLVPVLSRLIFTSKKFFYIQNNQTET